MTLIARTFIVLLGAAALAGTQDDKRKIEIYAENNEEGVSIRAPRSPGKDQMWEALKEGSFWSGSPVSVKHRIDKFSVDVASVQRKDPKQPMSGWLKPVEISKNRREQFTKKEGDQEPNFKECRTILEEKAKIQLGSGHMHRVKLTRKDGSDLELTEYIILSSDVLYVITVAYDKESFQKYFAKEGQMILNSIDRAKIIKKK